MTRSHSSPALWLSLGFLSGTLAFADGPKPTAGRVEDGLVTVVGRVRMADGSPAAGAVVESLDGPEDLAVGVLADDQGRFRVSGRFGDGLRWMARSRDGTQQAAGLAPSNALSRASAGPLEWTLAKAVGREVLVTAEGRPAPGATVAADGMLGSTHAVTGPDGKARLRWPANNPPTRLTAWHPARGLGAFRIEPGPDAAGPTPIALLAPAPLKVRIVDPDEKPVAGLEAALRPLLAEGGWIEPGRLGTGFAVTDEDGSITFPWAPAQGVTRVDVELRGPEWMKDRYPRAIVDRAVTIHARRRGSVEGKLAMPAGADPEGLLISGVGYGPGEIIDRIHARARADGAFTLRVRDGYSYALAVADVRWASVAWTGLILEAPGAKPADVGIPVRPATPLAVVVTSGQGRVPVEDAHVFIHSLTNLGYTDAKGQKRSTVVRLVSLLLTDRRGEVRAGVSRGPHRVHISSNPLKPDRWSTQGEFTVVDDEPVIERFHRD